MGAIIFELHRQERREPALLKAKAAELVEIDDEVRALTEALGEGYGLPRLTARGLVAACTACGGIMGVRDPHCPSCGAAAGAPTGLDGEGEGEGEHEPPPFEEPSYDDEIEVRAAEPQPVGVSHSNGDVPPAPWSAEPPSTAQPPPPREPLVPRAQRTLRAGRRLARTWIEERRSGGR